MTSDLPSPPPQEITGSAGDVQPNGGAGGSVPFGELDKTPAAQMLAELYLAGASGALLLKRGETKKIIYLRAGYPTAARSNLSTECLGKLLVWDGLITEEQRRESLALIKETGQRQGAVLQEMGVLAREDLVKGLALQARFRICEAFSWSEGSCRLYPDLAPPEELAIIETAPSTLILEGVRSFMSHRRVLQELRPVVGSFLRPSSSALRRFQALRVEREAEPLLEQIDGTHSVGELLRTSPLSIRETSALLYTVIKLGMVTCEVSPQQSWSSLRSGVNAPFVNPITVHTTPRAYLERLVERLRDGSPQEVLGVPEDAPLPTLRLAYQKRSTERHPDNNSGRGGEEVRALAVEALALTERAFAALTGPGEDDLEGEERTASITLTVPVTAEDLTTKADVDINDRVQRIIEAERHHQLGLELLEVGRFKDAARALSRAVSAYDDEGEFRTSLAWATFQDGLDDRSATQALEHLEQAIRLGRAARPHLYRGHILQFLGRTREAAEAFGEALRLDPDNEEAQSELARVLEALDELV